MAPLDYFDKKFAEMELFTFGLILLDNLDSQERLLLATIE
jgi:hypothetical protein